LTTAKPATHRIEREDVLLWLFAFTPVAAWIAAQLLSFLATRSVCTSGRRWILYLIIGSALAITVSAGTVSWTKWRGLSDRIPGYRRCLALGGVLLAAICAVSIFSLMIAATVHRPCD